MAAWRHDCKKVQKSRGTTAVDYWSWQNSWLKQEETLKNKPLLTPKSGSYDDDYDVNMVTSSSQRDINIMLSSSERDINIMTSSSWRYINIMTSLCHQRRVNIMTS